MKLELTCQWITQNKIDIFGCVELGKCWDLIEYSQRLPQKTGDGGRPFNGALDTID